MDPGTEDGTCGERSKAQCGWMVPVSAEAGMASGDPFLEDLQCSRMEVSLYFMVAY